MSQKECFTKAYNSSQISGLFFFFLAGNILDVSTNTMQQVASLAVAMFW